MTFDPSAFRFVRWSKSQGRLPPKLARVSVRETGPPLSRWFLKSRTPEGLRRRDGTLPENCCTIIAWCCASLGEFQGPLFSLLAKVAQQNLASCQAYEAGSAGAGGQGSRAGVPCFFPPIFFSPGSPVALFGGVVSVYVPHLAAKGAGLKPCKPPMQTTNPNHQSKPNCNFEGQFEDDTFCPHQDGGGGRGEISSLEAMVKLNPSALGNPLRL